MTPDEPAARSRTESVGLAGILVMLFAHLVWDPALTLVGVARFGIAAEGTAVVRRLLRINPVLWLVLKTLVVGGLAAFMYTAGVHRDWQTAWTPWVLASLGLVAPLGWLLRLL